MMKQVAQLLECLRSCSIKAFDDGGPGSIYYWHRLFRHMILIAQAARDMGRNHERSRFMFQPVSRYLGKWNISHGLHQYVATYSTQLSTGAILNHTQDWNHGIGFRREYILGGKIH